MDTIPSEIEEVFEKLKKEITWLHGKWIIYRQLFTESDKRIDLLNECATAFFYIIHKVLLDDVLISLSKLTDKAGSGDYENLSLEQLQKRMKEHGDQKLAAELTVLRNDLQTKCEPFRTWRNKRLAHLDLNTAITTGSTNLPEIERNRIEQALAIVREYMNKIEGHYRDSETAYDHFVIPSGGKALVSWLISGLRYEELAKEGKIPYDDWQHGKWRDA